MLKLSIPVKKKADVNFLLVSLALSIECILILLFKGYLNLITSIAAIAFGMFAAKITILLYSTLPIFTAFTKEIFKKLVNKKITI